MAIQRELNNAAEVAPDDTVRYTKFVKRARRHRTRCGVFQPQNVTESSFGEHRPMRHNMVRPSAYLDNHFASIRRLSLVYIGILGQLVSS